MKLIVTDLIYPVIVGLSQFQTLDGQGVGRECYYQSS